MNNDKKTLGQSLVKGLEEAVSATETKIQSGKINTPEEYFEAIKVSDTVEKIYQKEAGVELITVTRELHEEMGKALHDALQIIAPGGSIRRTVETAYNKYLASSK
jgi:S-adenosylmethionine:tRNA-ribosyltransferase-isomerase (queuine synthetase)